jgi:hypothetical protein
MTEAKPAWNGNPLTLGGLGVALLVAGYLAMRPASLPAEDENRLQHWERAADFLEKAGADPDKVAAAAALREEAQQEREAWARRWGWVRVAGRVAFWIGFAVVVVALVLWTQQARQPEPRPPTEEGETDGPGTDEPDRDEAEPR